MGSMLCLRTLEDVLDATQLAVNVPSDTWKLALFDDSLTIDVETLAADTQRAARRSSRRGRSSPVNRGSDGTVRPSRS
jgi:hypothetical protein